MREASRRLACLALLACSACATRGELDARRARQEAIACSEQAALQTVEQRASSARIEQLEAEIRRLQSDLAQAQQVIVAAESQLSGAHTRALAVRSLAEARSELGSAAARAPWKRAEAEQAEQLLAEADQHLVSGHFGAAILLSSRADRIARALAEESIVLRSTRGALQVAVERANLRAEPSRDGDLIASLPRGTPLLPERSEDDWALVRTPQNQIGWVHLPLLEPFSSPELR
jgi:hypothetical protein